MKCSLLSLSSYIDDELEAGKRGELEAHLVGCQRCAAGLEHLHEEVDRISGLAPVHVPDHSARSLMEQLGLIEPGESLPGKGAPRATATTAAGTLPWLNGEAGKALPWRADRNALRDETATQRVAVETPMPQRPVTSNPVVEGPLSQRIAAQLPAFQTPIVASPPVPPAPAPVVAPIPTAQVPTTPPPSISGMPIPPAPTPIRSSAPIATPAPSTDRAPVPVAPDRRTPINVTPVPMPPVPPAPRPVVAAAQAAPPSFPAPEAPVEALPGVSIPPRQTGVTPAWSPVISVSGLPVGTPPPARGLEVAPDVVEPAEWPAVADTEPASAGPFARLKERWAVQRALARTPVEVDDGIQVAPAPTPRMWARRHRGSPSDREALTAAATRPTDRDREAPTAAATRPQPSPGRHSAPLMARRGVPTDGPAKPSAARERLGELVRTSVQNRVLMIVGGGLVAVTVIGLTVGRSGSPITSRSPSTSSRPLSSAPAGVAPAPAAPSRSAAAQQAPAPSNSSPNSPGASAPPGTTAVQLTDVRTLGSEASGAQVKGIRYGDHPGSFFRAVLDVGGSAGEAAPKTTIGFKDPTTLWVIFEGATAGGPPAQPGPGGAIVSATQIEPAPAGKTIYEFKLAHPATVSNQYLTGPLRLVLDLH